MRLTAGYRTAEVVRLLEAEREEIEHLPLPKRGRRITNHWIAGELRHLRAEIREIST